VAQIRTASGLQKSRLSLIDTYTKMSFAKLYDRKTPITAADLLNDRVLPFFDEHEYFQLMSALNLRLKSD